MRSLAHRFLPVVLALGVVLAACTDDGQSTSSDTAATVNGVDIPFALVEDNVRVVVDRDHGGMDSLSAEERAEIVEPLQRTIVSLLIQTELVAELARTQGVEIDLDEVESRYAEDVEQAGGEDAFAEQLSGTMLTPDLYRIVVLPTDMRLAAVQQSLLVDEPAIELRTVRHILLESESEADAVVAELKDGDDFAQIAMDRSTDTGSGMQGGDLGPAPRGSYVEPFEIAVWGAQLNTIIGPVESQFGYHVIEVTGESTREVDELTQQDIDQLVGEAMFALITDVLEASEVTVAPGLGEWDPAAATVLAPNSVG